MHAAAAGGLRPPRRTEHHPTAEEVYRAVRLAIPRISLATVYKALEARSRPAWRPSSPPVDGRRRYDARRDPHYHFRCLRTGTVHDLPTRFDPDLVAKLDPSLGDPEPTRFPGDRIPPRADRLLRRGRARASEPTPKDASPLVDTHAHLDDPRLSGDLDGVLDRARGAGVVQVVAIGTTAADSAEVVDAWRGASRDLRRRRHPSQRGGRGRDRATGTRPRPRRPSPGRRDRRDRARPLLGPDALRPAAGVVRPPPGAGPRARPAGGHPLPRLRPRPDRATRGRWAARSAGSSTRSPAPGTTPRRSSTWACTSLSPGCSPSQQGRSTPSGTSPRGSRSTASWSRPTARISARTPTGERPTSRPWWL